MIINRDLLRIQIKNKSIKVSELVEHKHDLMNRYKISELEADYFVFQGKITNQAYQQKKENIDVLYKNGKIKDIVKASDQLNLKALSKPVTKHYMCYPKERM